MPSWLVVSKMCYFPTRKLDDPTLLSSGMAQPSSKNDGASDSPETGSEPAKTTSSRFQAIFCQDVSNSHDFSRYKRYKYCISPLSFSAANLIIFFWLNLPTGVSRCRRFNNEHGEPSGNPLGWSKKVGEMFQWGKFRSEGFLAMGKKTMWILY